jgi:phosphoglycolate phosphatase
LQYNPITRRYWLSGDTSVNYLLATAAAPEHMFAHIRAVLFDLDGTLIDSAPTWALLQTRCEPTAACPPCPWSTTAPWQALEPGNAGMRLRYAPEHPDFSAFAEEFFANYEPA